jgi:glycosyltransferase involved in cell wall biosynthesis
MNVIRAIALLNRRGLNVQLNLAAMSGKRELAEQWRQETELGTDALSVLPSLSDEELRNVYSRADVHCMPSTGEGFGIPVIEAASMGIPNVLSPIEVFRELMGEDAVFATSLGAQEIADALFLCLTSDNRAMTQSAKRRADRFTFDSVHDTHAIPVFQAVEAMVDASQSGSRFA